MSEISVEERLVRIETKIDGYIESLKQRDARNDARDADIEQRLRSLERRDALVLGASGVISLIMPFVLKKLGF